MNPEEEPVSTPTGEVNAKYEALRKEIDDMLSVLPGEWLVEEIHLDFDLAIDGHRWYSEVMSADRNTLLAYGTGHTKAEALEKILENWRTGTAAVRADCGADGDAVMRPKAICDFRSRDYRR